MLLAVFTFNSKKKKKKKKKEKEKKKYGSNNLLHEQFGRRNQGFCKRLSCQMSFTNVHNEFKTKLRKTGGDFIVYSSDVTLHSSQFIRHSSQFTLSSFLKWLNIYEPPHEKTNNVAVRSAKTQISLGIHAILLAFVMRRLILRDTKDFKLQTSQFIRHSSYFTLHSFLKRYFMYKRQLKVPFQSS